MVLSKVLTSFNCTIAELKLNEALSTIVCDKTFNCTIAELKFTYNNGSKQGDYLLIVP